VCVEIVAEQEGRILVRRREQARAAVVEEVALVDRLEAERVPLVGERREDGLQLALVLGPEGLGPERALARGLPGDRVPRGSGYDQLASSLVQ
jgi:hypothetical protein